jgi:hypothetical protein
MTRMSIAPLTLLLIGGASMIIACDGGPSSQPANHATATHSATIVDSLAGKKCSAGRRFGFMFWGHAKGEEGQRVMNAHFHDSVPGAVVWATDASSMTVVVPDEASGELVIQQARGLHLKIARVDWVGISADCQLTWMNHGESMPPASSDIADAGTEDSADASPPIDAGPPIDPALKAKSDACDAALDKDLVAYGQTSDKQTSVVSTRMLLRIFSKSCASSFPDLARAAEHASKVGRKERSLTLGTAAGATCASAAKAKVARDVIADCPPIEGNTKLPVWDQLDAGTYAFTQMLKRSGMHNTFTDELVLQASLHPELDK